MGKFTPNIIKIKEWQVTNPTYHFVFSDLSLDEYEELQRAAQERAEIVARYDKVALKYENLDTRQYCCRHPKIWKI